MQRYGAEGDRQDRYIGQIFNSPTMLLHNSTLGLFLLFGQPAVQLDLSTALPGPLDTPSEGVGFTEAIFSSASMQSIMSDRDCVGVRFYNAKLSATAPQGTLMAVGIRADGSDINGGILAHPYVACAPSAQNPAAVSTLSRNGASGACADLAAGGDTSFSASVPKADLSSLLAMAGCNGVRVLPIEGGGGTSLLIRAVTIDRTVVTDLGSGSGYERRAGDPCRAICVNPAN